MTTDITYQQEGMFEQINFSA